MSRAPSDARDRRTGRLLGGQWRLEAMLGEGGTSTVYSAAHIETKQRAAIKILRAALADERDMVEHFLAEGYLVAEIEHPGVVKVLDDGVTDDGCPYLVLEELVGQTLDDLRQVRGGRIPLDEVMCIADAVMDTLSAIHDAGITHRDLKPQNVIVLDGGGIKILDFGVAKVRGQTNDGDQSVVGTPSFMPPEQALGMPKKMDAQSDVWALGAVLFHALSGQPVHIAKHPTAMILASASTRPRSLADAAPEHPQKIVEVIDRALSYRKADRFSDIREMRAAWQEAHPTWLPTMPPPSYLSDPAFLDPSVLTEEKEIEYTQAPLRIGTPQPFVPAETPMAIALFDPREIANEAEEAITPLPPISIIHTTRSSRKVEAPKTQLWRRAAPFAATSALTALVIALGAALSSSEDHSALRPKHATAAAAEAAVVIETPPPLPAPSCPAQEPAPVVAAPVATPVITPAAQPAKPVVRSGALIAKPNAPVSTVKPTKSGTLIGGKPGSLLIKSGTLIAKPKK